MSEALNEPGAAPRQPQPSEIDNRLPPPDGGEIAEIAVAERSRCRLASETRGDHPDDVGALLFGDGGKAGQRAMGALDLCGVADRENFGVAGEAQIGPTATRPPRPGSTPSRVAAGEAATPAAQIKERLSMRSSPSTAPSPSHWVTAAPSRNSTPSRIRARAATVDSRGGKLGNRRGPASTRTMRAVVGSIRRKSRVSAALASSARAPASSTPVGPPPMMTKVKSRCRSAASSLSSARSKARRMRRRIVVASSIFFCPTDGKQHAVEVHIFLPAQRGVVPERQGPSDLVPDGLMTNAIVGTIAKAPEGATLHLTYKGGEADIIVGPDVPVVGYVPGDAGLLKPGAAVVLVALKKPDGSLTAARVTAEKNGVKPPM